MCRTILLYLASCTPSTYPLLSDILFDNPIPVVLKSAKKSASACQPENDALTRGHVTVVLFCSGQTRRRFKVRFTGNRRYGTFLTTLRLCFYDRDSRVLNLQRFFPGANATRRDEQTAGGGAECSGVSTIGAQSGAGGSCPA